MMQRLNKMFDGDWLLTVAAYNSGEGRVMKAVKRTVRVANPPISGRCLCRMKRKIYVPKMLALSDILKNSKRYGVKLPTADESRALARVRLDSPVDISQLADMAGMPVSKLKTFNAGVKGQRWARAGQSTSWCCRSTPHSCVNRWPLATLPPCSRRSSRTIRR